LTSEEGSLTLQRLTPPALPDVVFMKILTLPLLGLLLWPVPVSAAPTVDYQKDVKPIFAARCASCHGAIRQKAGLRLDASPLIRKGSKNGPVLVAGKSGESLLIDAVLGKDRTRMPPEKDGEALSQQQIDTLRAWIDQGGKAADEPIPEDPRKHWAFQPPVRSSPPATTQRGSPIDAFLAVEREAHGLTSNPPADRAILLRRVYLDLIGVPPTREELHAFVADSSPDAYEKVVDRLLASPQHGERWGRHWMDVWRYSDPFGFADELRYSQKHIWHWRDWIIESLNADRGYDRMIQEMLAGDEIAPTDQQTLRATGYLARNWYKFNRNAWMQDTVEHTALGILGLTMRCARCHDHKYDPISQQDYYRFRAFFEPHNVRIDPLPGQRDTAKDGIPRAFDAQPAEPTYLFIRGDDRYPDRSRVLTPGVPSILGDDELAIEPVRYEPKGPAQNSDPAVIAAKEEVRIAEANVVAARAAVEKATLDLQQFGKNPMPEPARPVPILHDTFAAARPDLWKMIRGKWSHEKGRLVQSDPGAGWMTMMTTKEHPRDFIGRVRYRTTGGKTYYSVGVSFDVVGEKAWQAIYTSFKGQTVQAFHRVNGQEVYPSTGIVPCPVALNQDTTLDFAVRGDLLNVWVNGQLKIVYRMPSARQNGVFALWNLEATSEFLEVRLEALPASLPLADKLNAKPSPLNGPIRLTRVDMEQAVKQAEANLAAAEKKVPLARTAVQTAESKAGTAIVSTGRRLALAKWMTRPDHPLTARVAINHVWLRHFGTPLVESVANFGLAGKKPTHPALLDWLAVRFVEDGWSFKKLHRLIVLSEAYQLSSAVPKDSKNNALDPDNHYLWRMNPRRMESEVVRDSLLAMSGQLDRTMAGPILDEKLGLTESRRRSVYFRLTTEHRMLFLDLFDQASPNECYERRASVVPQQALALSNSVLALNQARLLARSLQAPDDVAFVKAAFEQVLGRVPSREEQSRCEKFLADQRELLKNAGKLTPFPADSGAAVPPSLDAAIRARENLVHVLINHNDFVTIR
jgi:mono/diheme cytochrome c family protein